MESNRQGSKPLALEPIESTSQDEGSTKRQLRITIADEFVAEAAQEYQQGHVDQALWSRASQTGSDEALVVAAYLRARATALRMERRAKHPQRSSHEAAVPEPQAQNGAKPQSTQPAGARRSGRRAIVIAIAAGALVVLVAIVLMIAVQRQVEPAGAPAPSKAVPDKATPTARAAAFSPQTTAGASGTAARADEIVELETKVRQLKDVANWNVLVLYAAEWTRKDPGNAAAWSDLSEGYVNLRQFDDALNAANRAVQLSPADARLWRNVAQANLALDRLPDAATAFDNAVLANPGDVDAWCGSLTIARKQGRPKDADTIAARVKSMNGSCGAAANGDNTVAVHPAAVKPQASAR